MSDKTPEDYFQRWLRENPPPPRVVRRPGITDRIVATVAYVASAVLWCGIAYAIIRAVMR